MSRGRGSRSGSEIAISLPSEEKRAFSVSPSSVSATLPEAAVPSETKSKSTPKALPIASAAEISSEAVEAFCREADLAGHAGGLRVRDRVGVDIGDGRGEGFDES